MRGCNRHQRSKGFLRKFYKASQDILSAFSVLSDAASREKRLWQPEAYNNLGATQAELDRYEQAISFFERAVSLKPRLALAHYNLGVAHLRMKNREAALEPYRLLSTFDRGLADRLYCGIYQGKILNVASR